MVTARTIRRKLVSNMHHQTTSRYSRHVRPRLHHTSDSSDLIKSSNPLSALGVDSASPFPRRFSLLSPISPLSLADRVSPGTPVANGQLPRSAGPIRTKPALEKGLKLVANLYGPVPPLKSPKSGGLKRIAALIAAETTQEVKKPKEFQSFTLLDLEDFEKTSKKRLRRQANRSLPSLPRIIKFKITPASPRGSLD